MPGGYLIISARRTCAVYKVDRKTGEVVWRLGGKKSDFEMGTDVRTFLQHDARRNPDGTITIFDNRDVVRAEQSRGIVVEVDEDRMSASLVREYTHPDKLLSDTQGNVQVLPNGNVLVGWVARRTSLSSTIMASCSSTPPTRPKASPTGPSASRGGQPTDDPAIVVELGAEDEVTIYASWNGATGNHLASVGRERPGSTRAPRISPHQGFETMITLHTTEPYVGLNALNGSGRVLGTTATVELEDRT